MKHRGAKLIVSLAMAFLTTSAFADKVIVYNGSHGHGYRGGYHDAYYDDHYRGRRGKYCRNRRGFRDPYYGGGRRFRRGPDYGYQPAYHHHGYRSYTPVLAGGLIGGMIGAELGSDPAAIGGALLGASIGRDIAHRRAHRY